MDQTPVEILDTIFTLACTDGGFTGCSLSLASRQIGEIARSSRFYSVSLDIFNAPDRVQAFTTCFLAERARPVQWTPPRVRHLHLVSGEPFAKIQGNPKLDGDTRRTALGEQALALLDLIAPDLLTLTLVGTVFPPPALVSSTLNFPHLQELAIIGGKTRFAPWISTCTGAPASTSVPTSAAPAFPQLTHLRVTTDLDAQNLRTWAARAPKLAHVRFECIDLNTHSWVGAHRAAQGSDDPEPKLPALRTLIMQRCPGAVPPERTRRPGVPGSGWSMEQMFAVYDEELQKIALGPCRVGIPALSRNEDGSHKHPRGEVFRRWLDRLEGGPGCWGVKAEWFVDGLLGDNEEFSEHEGEEETAAFS
ncbi:uncharacterized protein BXZ73DRAFT_49274 [Epithele typhae]|uniref:uncharacterized protein n=1 Tax=Epithele typhae TaxID=378194 RepID=UPI0020075A3E|nr:uncharacterized protein BXZ73DRAFT_49274 [Epithele typhae]KAH9926621.1 hypothetical protein BXZ73DRAFT_49274 [Epithele typhae]